MKTETKKEISTLPTKAIVEISQKEKKEKSSSLRVYHKNQHLSRLFDQALGKQNCKRCGKEFYPTRPEYAWEDCCSYTCRLHRDDDKKKPHTKPVDMFTREGGYIMSFSCSEEAAKYVGLKKPHAIRDCCLGKTKTSAGFVFRYREANND